MREEMEDESEKLVFGRLPRPGIRVVFIVQASTTLYSLQARRVTKGILRAPDSIPGSRCL